MRPRKRSLRPAIVLVSLGCVPGETHELRNRYSQALMITRKAEYCKF